MQGAAEIVRPTLVGVSDLMHLESVIIMSNENLPSLNRVQYSGAHNARMQSVRRFWRTGCVVGGY